MRNGGNVQRGQWAVAGFRGAAISPCGREELICVNVNALQNR